MADLKRNLINNEGIINMKTKIHPAIRIFIFIISITMFIYSVWNLFQLLTLKYNALTTKGEIAGYYTKIGEAKFTKNRKPVYAPMFKYQTKSGKQITVKTKYYKKRIKYKKGDSVTVFYNENKPENAQIEASFPWKPYLLYLTYGIIGIILTVSPILNWKK